MEESACHQKPLKSYIVIVEKPTGIEVNVVDCNNARAVAIHFKDLGQMLIINAESARILSFCLMECADFIEPPFTESPKAEENDSFFGEYDDKEDDE
jgi:hypothetical protein